jgi:hypothetical protein
MPKRYLRVYANPYTFIDPEGRPAGVYSHDPAHLPGQMHVGIVRLETTVTEKRDPSKDTRSSLMDLVHHYDGEVQEIAYAPGDPGFKHYRDGLRSGDLIAADEATAKAAGLKFEDPGEVLGRARLKAVREWTDAHDGEPPAFVADEEAHAHVPDMLAGRRPKRPGTDRNADAPDGADPFPTDYAAPDARATEKGNH